MNERDGINPAAKPSGTGCVECLARGGWWLHLRRCAECGHIGCCDASPDRHASRHHAATGHPIITSFEPGEQWFYDYRTEEFITGPKLHAPHSHPLDQPGRSGAFKLAKAASRMRGGSLVRPQVRADAARPGAAAKCLTRVSTAPLTRGHGLTNQTIFPLSVPTQTLARRRSKDGSSSYFAYLPASCGVMSG